MAAPRMLQYFSYPTAVGLATRAMAGVRKGAELYKLCKDHTHAHCVTASGMPIDLLIRGFFHTLAVTRMSDLAVYTSSCR
jgi:hypothetical protein